MSLMGSLIFAFNFSSLGCGLILKLMAHLWWRRLLWTIPHLGAAIFDVAGGLTHLCVQLLFVRLCGLGLGVDGSPVLEEVAADHSSILEVPSWICWRVHRLRVQLPLSAFAVLILESTMPMICTEA